MVLDRPAEKKNIKVECVQPQWVADSLNNVVLLPTMKYFPGVPPPPHLSPFIDNKKEGYIPERQKEINQMKGISADDDDKEMNEHDDEISDASEDPEIKKEKDADDEDEENSDSEEEEENEPEVAKKVQKVQAEKLKQEMQQEEKELGKMLMTKKQRRIFQKVEHSQKKKKELADKLKEKKQRIKKTK